MEKTTIYGIGIFLLIVIGGYFLLGSSGNGNENVVDSGNSGDFQKVTIGMKNYNYYPNIINVEAGKTVRLSLDSSVSGCFRDFTIRELGIRKYLRTPSDYVEFTPTKPGTYRFACSMGMGTGTLIVE